MIDDWRFFRENPGRNYRCRLATPAEVANLAAHGALPPDMGDCFVYAFVRHVGFSVQIIFAAYLPLPELGEAQCAAAWHKRRSDHRGLGR
jgi:hypothetical protein